MTFRAAPIAALGLARLCALQLALSAGLVVVYTETFGYDRRIVWLHLFALGAVGALAGLILHLVLRASPRRAARRLAALAMAAMVTGLWLLYAADAVSNWFWRHNVTYDLAARYLARPRILAGYILLVVDWPAVVAAGACFAALALYVASSRTVDDGLSVLQAHAPARSRSLRAALGAVLLLSISGAAAVTMTAGGSSTRLMQREPLMGLFVAAERPDRLGLAALASQYRVEGPRVRAGYARGQDFRRRSVVLIVSDSLRSDHMPIYGYSRATTPFLRRLNEAGTLRVVREALATCPDSNCGISSILASKTFGSLVKENFKLHELFRDLGYAVHFVLSGDHDWLGLKAFYGDGITTYFDGNHSRSYDVTDDQLLFEGLARVPRFTGQPAFFYFHLMSTHVLGVRQDRHLVYRPSRARTSWEMYGRDDRQMRVNNYDNGVRQADAVIEQLLGALEEKGYLDDALVVITSDHGEGLGERGGSNGFGHAGWLYQEFIGIPFLIYERRDGAYANLQFATHVDVAPTIVDRLGLQVPSSWEGHSLLRTPVKRYSYHLLPDPPYQAVVHPAGGLLYKLLRHAGREELYELSTDPGERRDILSSADPALVADLRARLDDALAVHVERARGGLR